MSLEGRYAWTGNNRYGDNHRHLIVAPRGRGAWTFEWVRISSAGGMGKAGNTLRGGVERNGEGRFVLVGKTDESWVSDDDPWSQEDPSTDRLDLVVRSSEEVVLDGQTYRREKQP